MSLLPVPKLFKVIVGTTFDYKFQLVSGTPDAASPFNLTGWTGSWVIYPFGSGSPYATYTTSATVGESGVFFGLNGGPSTGIVDLIISSTDTTAILWTTAQHAFTITGPTGIPVTMVMNGTIGVVGSLPT